MNWRAVQNALSERTDGLVWSAPNEQLRQQVSTLRDTDLAELKRVWPTLAMYLYIVEHLPEKIDQGIQDLVLEAHHHATCSVANDRASVEAHGQVAGALADREKQAIVRRLNERGHKPKSKRGQHSNWDRESLSAAMQAGVRALKKRDTLTRRKVSTLDYKLRQRLGEVLKPPTSGEGLRKLIERFHLKPEWEALKNDWALPGSGH